MTTSETQESQVLLWLLYHPFQRIADIAMGLDQTEGTIARLLQKLSTQHMVEHVTPSSSRYRWYYLTTEGIRKVAEREGCDPVQLARWWQVDERHLLRLLPRLHQMAILQHIVYSLVSASPVALSDAGRAAQIRFGWQREYRVHFEKRQHVMRCDADAVVVLRRKSEGETVFFTLLVYLDMGEITDRTTMMRQLRNLLLYRESQERQAHRSMFPNVLIVVSTARQLELWQQAALEVARQLHLGKPLAGVIVNVARERPKSSLWNFNWRVLVSLAPVHLRDMLVPMNAQAVPPGILRQQVVLPERVAQGQGSRPVRGQYQARSLALVAQGRIGPADSPSQEDEMVALLSLSMSERYRKTLLMLYTHPLLTIEELALLSGLHPRTASRYVSQLSHWGYLIPMRKPRKARRSAGHPGEIRWALSSRGLLSLSASSALKISKLYQRGMGRKHKRSGRQTPVQRGVGQLYREWEHTRGVYHTVVAFFQAAAHHPEQSMAWFETHFRCARHYQLNKRWHNFRPDAVLEYIVKQGDRTRRFHFWIEWDGGTMGSKALQEKWQTYEIYLRSSVWRSRTSTEVLPLLLIIVPDLTQQHRVTHLVQEVLGKSDLHVRSTTQDLFRQYGPLSAIWTAILPRPAPTQAHLRALLDLDV
jgi:DNA-binding MarR family transcriptional regulator